jgi:dihydrofolate synthase/folylpolyglutamate synthase
MTDTHPTAVLSRAHEATRRLEALIEGTPSPQDSSRQAVQQRAEYRMGRLRRFLAALDNPHQGYPIVHVGGTSGKGSTTTTLAAILTAAGFTTGLHTSPYLQTPTEKLQVNGRLIAPDLYADLVDQILAAHDQWVANGNEPLTYGEAWFSLTALFYRATEVDVAVLEVGAGGRFDLTNIVEPVACTITSVGIDHTHTLGNTIADIAWHKAGIIKRGIPVVTAAANPEARAIIQETAASLQAPLTIVEAGIWTRDVETSLVGTSWTDGRSGLRHRSGLCGSFQAINGATAIAITEVLREQGLAVPDEAIKTGLRTARIPGRAEVIEDRAGLVLLDGAHNADKVAAIAADIPQLLPVADLGKRIAVLGVLEAKQALGMVRSLVPFMDVLVATSPQVTAKESKSASALATMAREAGFHGPLDVEPDPHDAIDRALALAGSSPGSAIFVTGSLYLVGNVRERWYREDEITLAQSPWPGATISPVS